MPSLPPNPTIGQTVIDTVELFDVDSDAFMAAKMAFVDDGKSRLPEPDDFIVSTGIHDIAYFWNGLCWLQWVITPDSNPTNVYIQE